MQRRTPLGRLLHLNLLAAVAAATGSLSAQNPSSLTDPAPKVPMALVLPTDNDGLLRGDSPQFYMYVDRTFENQQTTPWEGGQYGYVRGPIRLGSKVVMMAFHEGLDIAPLKRDAKGEPLDEVRSISHGEVVHVSNQPGASNYGRYIVIRHNWSDGPFYSLYAHLARVDVPVGRMVTPGSPIGILGYSGVGLDKRRAHIHLELNLFLSSRFNEWHEKNFRPSPNHHGLYNGLNLAGLDLGNFLLQRQKNPALSVSQYILTLEPEWKVVVPRRNTSLELLQNYPWLASGVDISRPSPSWEISISSSGMPIHIRPVEQSVTQPEVSWVKDLGMPHVYHTRKHVSGSGGKGVLTESGRRHVELLTSDFLIAAPQLGKP